MAKAKVKKHRWRIENPKAKCPRHPKKDFRQLVEGAWAAGWKCKRQRKYIYCWPPDEKSDWVKVPMTPSSSRTLANVRRNFRAAGLVI
jgi:hypothetical protein